MVDARALGARPVRGGGSSPLPPTASLRARTGQRAFARCGRGLEKVLPYLRAIPIVSKWETCTGAVSPKSPIPAQKLRVPQTYFWGRPQWTVK